MSDKSGLSVKRGAQAAVPLNKGAQCHQAELRVEGLQRAFDIASHAVGSAKGARIGQVWVENGKVTLRRLRYPEIRAMGDVAAVPKGQHAGTVNWQVPVVDKGCVSVIEGTGPSATYHVYISCPMIPQVGRAMLFEFHYHNNLVPSFPGTFAPLEELRISWLVKEVALKATYTAMLRGCA
ncbi:hypothetical protein [Tropicibacter oceani]|uniref:hypothetical protein n=1 Tax=Tropicibacter oceani TaxID=3058420 RepID=UPI003743379B